MTAQDARGLRFSVIVASHSRPSWLRRCLTGLRQLDYPAFEIIVVADREGRESLDPTGIKTVPFEVPNLAAARNIGIAHAGGDVCAFIDDDAVPEPFWLRHLSEAFASTSAAAVVGFVRGRNGISFQSRLASVDAEAETHEEPCEGISPSLPTVAEGRAVKLVGTNMAILRRALGDIAGFDETYRFFLEDADISLALANRGERIAVAPLAQVHHGFAPSRRRTRLRAPLDLFDIGRSTAYFLEKHLGGASEELRQRIERRERRRLIRHMIAGTCEPGDVDVRLDRLRAGWREGQTLDPAREARRDFAPVPFEPYAPARPDHAVLASQWLLKRSRLTKTARKIVESGGRASVFSFSLTPVRHHVRYVEPGYWLQTGGVFGKSDRTDPVFRWCRFVERREREIRRVALARGIGEIVSGKRWDHWRS
jgi:GT2 family glycosyltransferase